MNGSRTSDYDFELPGTLIAQEPLAERSASRLMVVHRDSGTIEHRRFSDIVELIPAGDLLVLNTTRVMKARLLGRRASGAPAEIFLLKPMGDGTWEAMVSPGGKVRPGRRVEIAPDLAVDVVGMTERRTRVVRLVSSMSDSDALERHGHVPLPPYIRRADSSADAARYQTVYAQETGSVAAPTAGLHLTDDLLSALARRGVVRADVVLHVGAGTFRPVDTDDPSMHVMHEERYSIPVATASAIAATRARDGKVWAVGTTSLRALESAADESGAVRETELGETRLFIRPGYRFRVVDRLITNFHLPRSTLLMLVAALAGHGLTMRAYREAVNAGYRFFSYGDAMAII
ncbi:MAG TPA: tRNA preQ1(34) S-adenosylmethionine ribosyltransferase-isomerase QueA [Gemmatimonadaceae bacterium]|nr:tRNA preQ1(34) S-adenosylmethionine ribosyltransferase-isomerase QueA [Gemmatimonadaceae bacterium]